MDYKNLPADLGRKLSLLKQAMRSEIPRAAAIEAKEHFRDNFRKGGFVNNGLQKWPDVKRRDPTSSWYGFEYKGDKRTYYKFSRDRKTGKTYKSSTQKKLNYSPTATSRSVLTSKRNYLMNSVNATGNNGRIIVFSNAPHAQLHNEGGQFRVFGKATATMPKRQFIGPSKELNDKVELLIINQIDKIFDK